MQPLPSPPDKAPSAEGSYLTTPTIPTSGRQRTAQACDKCRERKTKCSGEKPVCQRCTNRGLICEYSYREPRVRGPARTRVVSSSTPPSSTIGDSGPRACFTPTLSRRNPDFSRFNPSYRELHPTEYTLCNNVPNSAAPRHQSSSSPYLGSDTRSYSEPRAMHLPHWADVRHPSGNPGLADYRSSQSQMSTTPRDTVGMGYGPYPPLSGQPQRRHDPRLGGIPNSSTFLFGTRESPQYNNNDIHYDYSTNHTTEHSQSGSSDNSRAGYHSNGTPTPPLYPQGHLEKTSSDGQGGPLSSDYSTGAFGKRVYTDDHARLLDFSYGSKDLGIREDWRIGNNTNSGRDEQQTKDLPASLWPADFRQMDVDFSIQAARGETVH